MTDLLRIKIRPDWDAALTYDSLHEPSENRPVFVGREVLIAPLVAEISEPNKRGTYLISGYRGTGKTTLLIEALSRAQKQLAAKKITLFPLVLNVSEVAASLGVGEVNEPLKLGIDPRRLLVALIRTIREQVYRLKLEDESTSELIQRVDYAYEKATAAKFSRTGSKSQEETRTRTFELALALSDKNVLMTLGLLTGAAAIAFEAAALLGPTLGWLHAAALALGGATAISLAASWKYGRSNKSTSSKQTALEHDNSLQQLETDLKDILASLKKNKLRAVVVMEELDKLEDKKGEQLAAVIRYFKNLFTQAPALFFFVTDKGYFDIVASAIKRARRSRSYAVEHTFFTHRIFVGRPTTEESLEYISAIVADDADRTAIKAIAQTLGKPGRNDEVDRLGKFVRVVLFSAANHLFDLKNELRRFARNEEITTNGTSSRVSSFLIDEQTLPPEQEALAVFQDLIVEKSRAFEIKGGRTYANETLADSLYAVFNELGSNHVQRVNSFLPITNDPQAEDALLLDEQLDLSEAARVRDAVHSLSHDLERGRAVVSRNLNENSFSWREDAARSFRYVRQLQKHEEALIAELERHATLVNALSEPGIPNILAVELGERVKALREAPESMTADAALAQQREVVDRYGNELSISFDSFKQQLEVYGFKFELVAKGLGGSLHLVKPNSGDPRLKTSSPRGGVLLAFGETETLATDVLSFINPTTPSLARLDRVALVHVIHAIGVDSGEVGNRRRQWNDLLAQRIGAAMQVQQNQAPSELLYAIDVVPLVATEKQDDLTQVEKVAGYLAAYGTWSVVDNRPYEPIGKNVPNLESSLDRWIADGPPVFHIPKWTETAFRYFGERNVLETDGRVVISLGLIPKTNPNSLLSNIATACMLNGFGQSFGGPQLWEPVGKWILKSGRIVLFVDWQVTSGIWSSDEIKELIHAGARVILVKDDPYPFDDVPSTKGPITLDASEQS